MNPIAADSMADLLLRGAVGGVLLFHLIHLLLPGPRRRHARRWRSSPRR
jgi:hypothetical protein